MKHLICLVMAVLTMALEVRGGGSLADFCRRAERGDQLTVAYHGGSLTFGANASDPNRTSWRALLGKKLTARFPLARFTFVDAAIGGTDSQLGVFRLDRDVLAYKPDLLIVEWCCNDGIDGANDNCSCSYEGLVRRFMAARPNAAVAQVIIPVKETVLRKEESALRRRTERLAFGRTYGLATADVLGELRRRWRKGGLSLDAVWPPEIGDMTHPFDPGYALYAEIIWQQLFECPSETKSVLPSTAVFAEKYRHLVRRRLSECERLPPGWRNGLCEMRAGTFDFLCSRWQDGTTIATNSTPLKARFRGEVLLLFGESTVRGGDMEVWVDGKLALRQDCGWFGRMFAPSAYLVVPVGTSFDGDHEHRLEIRPVLKPGQTLKIESICVAGETAAEVRFEPVSSWKSEDLRLPLADPQILAEDGVYYAYGTHAKNGIAVATSTDLVNWEMHVGRARDGLALHADDSFGKKEFWAPEVHRRADGKYVMFYSAERQTCTALANSPLGPFVQPVKRPLFPSGWGQTIDNTLAYGNDGKPRMFYAYLKPDREEIWSVEMSNDLLTVVPETARYVLAPESGWEMVEGRIAEGPSVVQVDGLWYLLYSANSCSSHDYAVGFATAPSLAGPWTRAANGLPFLRRVGGLVGTGHGAPFLGLDGKWRYVFHSHDALTRFAPRRMNIVEIEFSTSKGEPSVAMREETLSVCKTFVGHREQN